LRASNLSYASAYFFFNSSLTFNSSDERMALNPCSYFCCTYSFFDRTFGCGKTFFTAIGGSFFIICCFFSGRGAAFYVIFFGFYVSLSFTENISS
jgi:hypothetical protein